VRKPPICAILAALLLSGIAGCADSPSRTQTSYATSAPPADAFPLTVTRRGGFAGVDDSARITADGSAVVTHRGRSPVQTSLPAGTMAELGRLLATPGRATASAAPSTCDDGYEYEIVSPSASMAVHGCDIPQDRLVAIAELLFKA
jgi:hypothetical protein